MCFFDLQPKLSFAETWNQASGNLPDLCARLNTHIGIVGDFLTGVRPTTNYFVIFQPGSGQLLSNFVIFIGEKLVYDTFFQ